MKFIISFIILFTCITVKIFAGDKPRFAVPPFAIVAQEDAQRRGIFSNPEEYLRMIDQTVLDSLLSPEELWLDLKKKIHPA